jgi:hypothetical protein
LAAFRDGRRVAFLAALPPRFRAALRALFLLDFLAARFAAFFAVRFAAFFAVRLAPFLAALRTDFLTPALAREDLRDDFRAVDPEGVLDGEPEEVLGVVGEVGAGAGEGGYSIGSGSIQPEPDQPISI